MLVCRKCKGKNIQIRQWVDANTLEYKGDTEDGDVWCEDCEEMSEAVEAETEHKFVVQVSVKTTRDWNTTAGQIRQGILKGLDSMAYPIASPENVEIRIST